jgi:hypothetical protein
VLAIALIAGLALGATYALTKEPIRRQNLIKAEQARRSIFGRPSSSTPPARWMRSSSPTTDTPPSPALTTP